jgi:hypothetical protein
LAGCVYGCKSVLEFMENRLMCGRTAENYEQGRNSDQGLVACFLSQLWNFPGGTERNHEHFSRCRQIVDQHSNRLLRGCGSDTSQRNVG